jgi:hypothetical protein
VKSSGESTSGIRPDMVEEALRICEEAERQNLELRLLGGVAIKLRAKDGLQPAFEREYADLDWITPKGTSADAQRFFKALGYEPHVRFNSMYGQERLLFFDREHDRQVDILVGTFRMSHEIRLGKRLDMEPLTIPLADLLPTKLQIVELNEKVNTTGRGVFI